MKLTGFLILFLLSSAGISSAQPSVQRGTVVEQNSGKKTLGNVQIQATGASPEVSDNEGNFRLSLSRHRPGQLIFIDKIEKKGYAVINRKEVDQWTFAPEKEFSIVMCPASVLQRNIEKYYNIGSSNYKEKFNRIKQKIEKEKEQRLITELEFDRQYEELLKTLNKEMQLLTTYSELFARINKDDLTETETQAFALLDKGKLNEAVSLYEAQKYLDRFTAQLAVEKTADDAIEALIPSLRNNADVYIFAGGAENYAKAENILRVIASSDTTVAERVKPYLSFLVDHEKYGEAEKWCGILFRNTGSVADKAEVMNMRGVMDKRSKNQSDVEKHYNEAISLVNDALKKEPNPYYSLLKCTIYCNMATYYSNRQENDKARRCIGLAVSSGEKIAKDLGGKYAFGMGTAYMQLALIDYVTDLPANSIDNGTKAIAYIGMARDDDPEKSDYCIALVNNTMANAYMNMTKYEKAKACCDAAIGTMRKLAEKGPAVYRYDLANMLNALGLYYYNEQNYKQASIHFNESVGLFREAGIRNAVHIDKAVLSLENLAMAYRKMNEPEKSAPYIEEAFAVYEEYLEVDYTTFAPLYAHMLCNEATFLKKDKRYEEALALLKRAGTIYEQLNGTENIKSIFSSQANCYNLLGTLLNNLGNEPESEKYYLESVAVYDKMKKEGQVIPAYLLANAYGNLGVFYQEHKKTEKAAAYYEKAIGTAIPGGKIISDPCTDLAVTCVAHTAVCRAEQGKTNLAYEILNRYGTYVDSIRNDVKRENTRITFCLLYRNVNELAKRKDNNAILADKLINSYEYLIGKGENHYFSVGLLYQERGQALFDGEKFAEATPWFIKAVDRIEEAYKSDPENEQVAILLITSYTLSGLSCYALTEFDGRKKEFILGTELLNKAKLLAIRYPENMDAVDFLKTINDLLK